MQQKLNRARIVTTTQVCFFQYGLNEYTIDPQPKWPVKAFNGSNFGKTSIGTYTVKGSNLKKLKIFFFYIFLFRVVLKVVSDQRQNRGVWSNINTRYLVWRCGDGRSFAL
jgi:hypothetical protein